MLFFMSNNFFSCSYTVLKIKNGFSLLSVVSSLPIPRLKSEASFLKVEGQVRSSPVRIYPDEIRGNKTETA